MTKREYKWAADRTFLSCVAQDLLKRFGTDMTKVTVVFPNKRARLFLNEELLAQTPSPMWAPRYATIGELFDSITGDEVMEPIPAVCRLYGIYQKAMGNKAESLDMFWGWGEIIMHDFEDIDKHLVDADALFLNALELNQMESLDFLTENQRTALENFFGSFATENKTRLQERFTELWTIMPRLYHGILEDMPEGMVPYRGALERKAVECKALLDQLDEEMTYCFVGFNMLSETEKKLMSYLHDADRALFYWDYDVMYQSNRDFEAGDFIRENLLRFPNALASYDIYDNISRKSDVTFVATSTDSIATRYIPEWLGSHLTETERETALVLCDEQQLQTVLHAIPDEDTPDSPGTPQDINITMGYTLSGTPVYSLVMALIALQTDGWDGKRKRFRWSFLKSVQVHPYSAFLESEQWNFRINSADSSAFVTYLDDVVMALAQRCREDGDFDNVLMLESIYMIHKSLCQFKQVATDERFPLNLQPATLRRLLRRVLGTRSIPFHGEPAQGLQVMGVLETRCLDFKNILMLNVGEGFLPKNGMDNSMIPFTLRVGFGLTTIRHRVAVFAYYFYRLIQRAQHVTCIYNENSSGDVRHEMSRFLRQLQAETEIPIRYLRLEASQDSDISSLEEITKSEEILGILYDKFDTNTNPKARPLTPSAINRYLDCKMKFYLSSVCGMRVEQDPEEGIDPRMMGNIFHNVAEKIYREIMSHTGSKTITREAISVYTRNKGRRIQPIIDKEFAQEAKVTEFRGENILIREVIQRYLLNLLEWDMKQTPFSMEAMESDVQMPIDIQVGERKLSLYTGGRVDRMDVMRDSDGTERFRIVDYKTGSHENDVKKLDDIFKTGYGHAGYYLQTFLYALALDYMGTTDRNIKPVLFYPAKANSNGEYEYDPTLNIGSNSSRTSANSAVPVGEVENISLYKEEFMEKLTQVIEEIFSPDVPFSKTDDMSACKYCDYCKLCNR